jgi:hypothetical protein
MLASSRREILVKNLVYISSMDGFEDRFPYGIKTVSNYCNFHNIPLVVKYRKSSKVPAEVDGSWYPWFDPYLKEQDWDKVIVLDADIMIHWDAPNMFEEFADIEFGVVLDSSDPIKVGGLPHLTQWSKHFFVLNDPKTYFNAGFVVTNRECYDIIAEDITLYFNHWVKHRPSAQEQTPLNLIARNRFVNKITYLDRKWNDMIFYNYDYKDGQNNFDFIEKSWVWHFTGQSKNLGGLMGGTENRANLMKQTFDRVKNNYKADWLETLLREIE